MIWPILKARAEFFKKLVRFFGRLENTKISFWTYPRSSWLDLLGLTDLYKGMNQNYFGVLFFLFNYGCKSTTHFSTFLRLVGGVRMRLTLHISPWLVSSKAVLYFLSRLSRYRLSSQTQSFLCPRLWNVGPLVWM